MESPRYYGERRYCCKTYDRLGRPRPAAHSDAKTCSLIEAASVRDLNGNLVWFENSLGLYPKEKDIYQALTGLTDYLGDNDPLQDRLDTNKRSDEGISLCHKRMIISPHFLNNPSSDSTMIQDEILGHVVIKPPLRQQQVLEVNRLLTQAVEEANHKRAEGTQLDYYHYLLDQTDSKEEIIHIQERIAHLLDSGKPITKRNMIADRSGRTQKALRGIRALTQQVDDSH